MQLYNDQPDARSVLKLTLLLLYKNTLRMEFFYSTIRVNLSRQIYLLYKICFFTLIQNDHYKFIKISFSLEKAKLDKNVFT